MAKSGRKTRAGPVVRYSNCEHAEWPEENIVYAVTCNANLPGSEDILEIASDSNEFFPDTLLYFRVFIRYYICRYY